jgi:hypothetical protein
VREVRIAALVCSLGIVALLSGCPSHKRPPPGPLIHTLGHPVETPWTPAPTGPWQVRFEVEVRDDAGRESPPTRTYPCVDMEVRSSASGTPAGSGVVDCDQTVTPTSVSDMTVAAEALLGAPSLTWSFGSRFLVAQTPRWAYTFIEMPPGSKPAFRVGPADKKGRDPWNDGMKCSFWGGCVVQEYEATLRKLPDVRQVVGFLSDIPAPSVVLLVVAPGATPSALQAAVLADHPGPHNPIRVRLWPILPASPTSEELWGLMDAEGKMPP